MVADGQPGGSLAVEHAAAVSGLAQAALAYAKWRWSVFPIHTPVAAGCSCGRTECAHIGKHPRTRHGFNDATTELAVIRQWWQQWPDANVGIATGAISGLVVLDIDPRHGGDQTLAAWLQHHGHLPLTVAVTTGQGGRHLYFAHPGGPVKSRTIGPGVDVRADGGAVVAPPSLHASGRQYQWEPSSQPDNVPVAELPAWLLGLVREPSTGAADVQDQAPGGTIPAGSRNVALTQLAGGMRRAGLEEQEILAALRAANRNRCQPPLGEAELADIARSVARYQPGSALASSSLYSVSDGDDEPVELHSAPWPGPRQWVVDGLIPQGSLSILYGEGGMAKSLLAMLIGDFVARGEPLFGLTVTPGHVLYLDWELDREEQARRAYRLAAGLGHPGPAPGFYYRQMAAPLNVALARIEGWVRGRDVHLLVVDSFGLATLGDPLAAKDVVPLLAAVTRLPCTALFIDHVRNSQPGEQPDDLKPFGSVYKFNVARSVLRAVRVGGDEVSVTLLVRQTKSNFGARRDPLGLRVTFEETRICFEQLDPGSPELRGQGGGSSLGRVAQALTERGTASPADLAAATGLTVGSVRNRLTELHQAGQAVSDGKGTWRARQSSPSPPLYGDDEGKQPSASREPVR